MNIRKYKPDDRQRLRHICKETAWDSYKKDVNKLETVPIVYNDYFTEYESENIFVAVNEKDEPIGYVICSTDFELFKSKMLNEIKDTVYKTKKFEIWQIYMVIAVLTMLKPQYRTHLHIDILPEYQHMGIGSELLKCLSLHLWENNIDYMSVCGISKNSVGYKFYCKFGFEKIKVHGALNVSMTYKTKKEEI